jgi:hypothetical protein
MSEPSFWTSRGPPVAVLALVLLALASIAAAQSTEVYSARVARLEERLRQIRNESARSGYGDTLPGDLDTLWVGPIRLLAPAPAQRFVQVVAERLRDSLDVVVRGDTGSLPSVAYLVRPTGPGSGAWRLEGVRALGYRDADAPGRERETADVVASGLLGALRQDLLDLLEPAVRRWLDQYWVPLDTLTQIQARTVYLELATTPWRAGAACYAGDVEACRVALALGAGGPESWYTAEERRQLVASAMEYHADVQRDLGVQRCVNTADEQACLETLRSYPALTDEPLSPMARQTLVRVAFGVGGNGAFGRFVRSDSRTLPDRLAHTAGVPLDSLVVRWRSAIVEARPTGTVLSRLGGWTAFMWVVVLSVVAMRSTRWRIR